MALNESDGIGVMLEKTGALRNRVHNTLMFLHSAGSDLEHLFYDQADFLKIKAGNHLLIETQNCEILGFVLSGRARVYKLGENGREITLFRVEAGGGCILAASCILNDTPYPAFALAETDIEAVAIPASVFRCWVEKYPFWRSFVFQLVAQRIESVITLVEEVAFQRMDTRIAEYLTEAVDVPLGVLRVTHQKIAADLGTSREVVSRILKDFEHRGWISLSRNAVQIKNLEALREPVH